MSDGNQDVDCVLDSEEKLCFTRQRAFERDTAFEFANEYFRDLFNQDRESFLLVNVDVLVALSLISILDHRFENDPAKRERGYEAVGIYVPMIIHWIHFINANVFYAEDSNVQAGDFLHLLLLNHFGRIDYRKTAVRLLGEEKISALDKLKIACLHCVESEIVQIIPKFPDNTGLLNAPKNMKKLVNFFRELFQVEKYHAKDVEILIHSIGYENYDALKYFWYKLLPTQKNRVLARIFQHTKSELHTWWLNEMTLKGQQYVMKRCGVYILINLMDEKWTSYFFEVAYFARDILSIKQFYEVIKEASVRVRSSNEIVFNVYLQIFHFIWRLTPTEARQYVYEQEEAVNFFDYLTKTRDFEFFGRFFLQAPLAYKKKFLDTGTGEDVCLQMVHFFGDFELFHKIVNSTYPEKEEAFGYKVKMMNNELGLKFVSIMLDGQSGPNEKLNKADKCFAIEFFEKKLWYIFVTEEAVKEYKKQCLYGSQMNGILNARTSLTFFVDRAKLNFRSELNINQIDKFIYTYVPEKEIENFKNNELCRIRDVVKVLLIVIKMDRYDFVDKFLKWSFSNDKRVADYKRNFYNDRSQNEFIETIAELVMKKDNFKALKKFTRWCSITKENHRQLSDMILTSTGTKAAKEMLMPMWRYLLIEGHLELADSFFKLCGYVSKQDMQDAKKKLFKEMNWIYLIFGVWSRSGIEDLSNRKTQTEVRNKCRAILRWFNDDPKTFEDLVENGLFVDEDGSLTDFFKIN